MYFMKYGKTTKPYPAEIFCWKCTLGTPNSKKFARGNFKGYFLHNGHITTKTQVFWGIMCNSMFGRESHTSMRKRITSMWSYICRDELRSVEIKPWIQNFWPFFEPWLLWTSVIMNFFFCPERFILTEFYCTHICMICQTVRVKKEWDQS
jgi:hypothetical protein